MALPQPHAPPRHASAGSDRLSFRAPSPTPPRRCATFAFVFIPIHLSSPYNVPLLNLAICADSTLLPV
eukprot:3938106-Rhodomonas_salina.2